MTISVQRTMLEPAATRSCDEHDSGNPRTSAPHPYREALVSALGGYVLLTAALLGIGLLLTHALNGSVGRWDEHVNSYFARHRTGAWNDITEVATSAMNTVPVVVAAVLIVGGLALRRRLAEAAFLIVALVLEISVFLSVTFVVARPRPAVPRLNSTPSTSSFPSGHTAAATVLFVGIAVIVACCTRKQLARVLSAVCAAAAVLMVGFARVYRGLHHPTDVLAGLVLGLACLAISAIAVRRARRRTAADTSDQPALLPTASLIRETAVSA